MSPKLSVIIPVYNVERYVGQTLSSISQQNHLQNTQVVIVDDGTPDHSMAVVADCIKKIPHAIIITQQNGGLSAARNRGLQDATGEYVWFVDSDDYLLPTAFDSVFDAIQKHPETEVFASMLEVHDESGCRPTFNEHQPAFETVSGMDYLKARCPQGAIQRFVFKRDFLDRYQLRFCPGILHEDDLFGFTMLYLAKNVCVLPRPVYVYRINRGGSIMKTISMRTPHSLIFIHKELKSFMMYKVKPEDRASFQLCIYNEIRNFFAFCINILDQKDFLDYYRECKPYIKEETKFLLKNRKTFFFGLRMMIFPRLPHLFYRYARDFYHIIKP